MTLELPTDLEEKLRQMSDELNRPADQLVREALTSYLQQVKLFADEVREGEESADRDGWLTTDEVFERLRQRPQAAA